MIDVHITKRASVDLNEIYEYSILKWGIKTAKEYILKIQEDIELLKSNPDILIKRPDISNHFLVYQVEMHWLICIRNSKGIIILCIKHVSLDLLSRLQVLQPTLENELKAILSRLQ